MAGKSPLIQVTLVALAAGSLCGARLAAQVGEKERLEKTLAELSRELVTLEQSPSLAPSVHQAKQRIQWFEGKLASWSPASADEGRPLREGLEIDLQALRQLPADPDAALGVVAEVEADLAVKAAHCKQAGLSALVTTKVRTFRTGQEVTGLEVFYIQKVLEPKPPANPPRFPALSATEQKLAPGRYVFWAGTPADTPVKSTIAVGNGEPETRIELLVR